MLNYTYILKRLNKFENSPNFIDITYQNQKRWGAFFQIVVGFSNLINLLQNYNFELLKALEKLLGWI